jgi:hypothetical protein
MLFLHDIYHIIGMEQDNLYNLLQSIDTPDDLRHLSADKLPEVCKELRQKIIDELSCNPGHFGSSLGVIELTVALHYVFNTQPFLPSFTSRRIAICSKRAMRSVICSGETIIYKATARQCSEFSIEASSIKGILNSFGIPR